MNNPGYRGCNIKNNLIYPIIGAVLLALFAMPSGILGANASYLAWNPNPTSISKVYFNPVKVYQNEYYVTTLEGKFPDDAVFDAVFTSTTAKGGFTLYSWQSGRSQEHLVTEDYPPGLYNLKEIYANVNGKRYKVWSGTETIEILSKRSLPAQRCNLIWAYPFMSDGTGIRETGDKSEVLMDIRGLNPSKSYKIRNTNVESNTPSMGHSIIRNQPTDSNGNFFKFDRTSVLSEEYGDYPGKYKTEILDSSGKVVLSCSPSFVIHVDNNAPVVPSCSISPSQPVTVGSPVTVNYEVSDPDNDPVTVGVIWGDGDSSIGGPTSAQHTYSTAKTYGIAIIARDTNNAVTPKNCGQIVVNPAPTPSNKLPKGFLDGVTSSGVIYGWALDPNRASESIDVHIYFDGPAGTGTFITSVTTNVLRPDVNQAEGVTGTHGFNFNVPQSYKDGNTHTVYAYGIDKDDSSGKSNVLLTGSPKSFVFGASGNNPPQISSCTHPTSVVVKIARA